MMIQDLDFLDNCAALETIIGAGASASTGVGITVGPGYAAGGAGADATGRTSTSTDTQVFTLVMATHNAASGRALALASAFGQDGTNTAYSSDRAGGYSNGSMSISYTAGSRR
jgi:hypothetical protein